MSNLNSINTNMGAMVALQSLNTTNAQLASVQKQISTGYRVADSTDDGAAYAVAQRVRSDVSALTTVNQQLGGVQGLLSTTMTGLGGVQTTMNSMRTVLEELASSDVTGSQRTNYATQYTQLSAQLKGYIQDAGYNGKTLIGDITGSVGSFNNVSLIRNEVGATYGISTFGGSAVYTAVTFGSLLSSTTAAASFAALI